MNCQEIKKLLIPFLESELSDSERLIIEVHLDKCDDCQKEKALLEKTWSMLDGFQALKVSSNFTANLMARIHDQEEVKPGFIFVFPEINIKFGFRVLVPAMASVCVLVVVYLFVQNLLVTKQQVAKVFSSQQEYMMQAEKNVPAESKVNVAEVAPIERKEDTKIAATEFVKNEKAKIGVTDAEIIRHLDVYENMELYQNLPLLNDLDVVQNIGVKVS